MRAIYACSLKLVSKRQRHERRVQAVDRIVVIGKCFLHASGYRVQVRLPRLAPVGPWRPQLLVLCAAKANTLASVLHQRSYPFVT